MRGFFALGFLVMAQSVWAGQVPTCLDFSGNPVGVNDAQVLQWKQSTPNQYKDRGHVTGKVIQLFPDHSGHSHFAISLGPDANDGLEVIFNQDFGAIPDAKIGDDVEACGDYITSTAQSGPYPASPEGAILHWVHKNPHGGHPSGFLIINGTLYGQGNGTGGSGGDLPNF